MAVNTFQFGFNTPLTEIVKNLTSSRVEHEFPSGTEIDFGNNLNQLPRVRRLTLFWHPSCSRKGRAPWCALNLRSIAPNVKIIKSRKKEVIVRSSLEFERRRTHVVRGVRCFPDPSCCIERGSQYAIERQEMKV